MKFQTYVTDKLFSYEALMHRRDLRMRVNDEIRSSKWGLIAACVKDRGLLFGTTPYCFDVIDLMWKYVDFWKVSSYQILQHKFLAALAHTRRPIVLSTGMATMVEVEDAVQCLTEAGSGALTLLHCVSSYPCPPDQANLRAIETMRRAFPEHEIGWSDHTRNARVVRRAISRFHAAAIEFHFDFEGGREVSAGYGWGPGDIFPVIAEANGGSIEEDEGYYACDGDGEKRPVLCEERERDWRSDPEDGLRPMKHARTEAFLCA